MGRSAKQQYPLGHSKVRNTAASLDLESMECQRFTAPDADHRAAATGSDQSGLSDIPGNPPAATSAAPIVREHTAHSAPKGPCAASPDKATRTRPLPAITTSPSSAPSEPEGLKRRNWQLARAASLGRKELPGADVSAAVELGQLAAAVQGGSGDKGDAAALSTAAAVGIAAAEVQQQGLSPIGETSADWCGFGLVVPVLSAGAGSGASVVSTVLADAMQLAGHDLLMVDTADPARSGLSVAALSDGPVLAGPHPAVRVRFSWRAQAMLARIETDLPVITPGMVPPPRFFKPADQAVRATVVDVGHDPWRVAAHPLAGPGAWLRRGAPCPEPILVCRPTRPSLLHAEQVLARLDAWKGTATSPVQLVVAGAKSWPSGVRGCAGRRVSALLEDALFLPHDPVLHTSGITARVTPQRLRDAVTPLLHRWELAGRPPAAARTKPRLLRGKGANQ